MSTEYDFSMDSILRELPTFRERGITELALHDKKISSDKNAIATICRAVQKIYPDLFLLISVQPQVIDRSLVEIFQSVCCSLEIPMRGTEKGGALLFDRKLYSSRADLLNRESLVFGFDLEYGLQGGDSFKSFRDRLDFAMKLYPNHIDFAQLEGKMELPKSTGTYSSKDLEYSREMAFACQTFYSEGRAVPWFNSAIRELHISPSAFFSDFSEWQRCNNCSLDSDFRPSAASHAEIEKMQLNFLKQKYAEKHKPMLFDAVSDLVRLNGAFSRAAAEGEETILELSYNPDDLLSPDSENLARFADSVPMESSRVRVFVTDDGPDYRIL